MNTDKRVYKVGQVYKSLATLTTIDMDMYLIIWSIDEKSHNVSISLVSKEVLNKLKKSTSNTVFEKFIFPNLKEYRLSEDNQLLINTGYYGYRFGLVRNEIEDWKSIDRLLDYVEDLKDDIIDYNCHKLKILNSGCIDAL